jgi:hypothetical protein
MSFSGGRSSALSGERLWKRLKKATEFLEKFYGANKYEYMVENQTYTVK